ncbi:hypothetical protein EUGRSUZ_B01634 [Eucalyptus grandis]|uniref:Transmembrane protein n=2 Tax=Eucalyptus grandis TaxID=71139 RepID=A0A059D2J5_EUCGR|nr:hypothetical protein EUGRSUZ_B01634 [Eucalyptus grandis]
MVRSRTTSGPSRECLLFFSFLLPPLFPAAFFARAVASNLGIDSCVLVRRVLVPDCGFLGVGLGVSFVFFFFPIDWCGVRWCRRANEWRRVACVWVDFIRGGIRVGW